MEARYTRLYAGADGVSHFEDLAIELLPGFVAPPAEPLHSAAFLHTGRSTWLGGTAGWRGEIPHPTPRRLLFVYLEGLSEITTGDGEARLFGPGTVLLAEDTTGTGHSTRIIEPGVCLVFSVEDALG